MDEQTRLAVEEGSMLPLMEAFYSIQGEGFYTGSPAYFLRIGGCDVGCHWCDVKESWDSELYPPTLIDKIITNIKGFPADTIVITGGEPLMWNLNKLTDRLKLHGYKIHLETSGAYSLTGIFDWVCLSPKKQQPPLGEIKELVDELKIIIHNKHDLQWAQDQCLGLKEGCKLYLQPEWSNKAKIIPMIVDFIKKEKDRDWKISLQSHKYMNVP